MFDEAAQTYQFGQRTGGGGGRGAMDPVEKEARRLCRAEVDRQITEQGVEVAPEIRRKWINENWAVFEGAAKKSLALAAKPSETLSLNFD